MGINIDLNQIPNKKLLAITICILSMILPPFWFIYQFYRELFYKTDLLTLLILSLANGFPVILISIAVISLIKKTRTTDEWYINIILGSSLSAFTIYFPSVNFVKRYVPLKDALIHYRLVAAILFSFFILYIIYQVFLAIRERYRNRIKTPVAPADLHPHPNPTQNQSDT
jgi:hypothetical protein